MGEDFFERLYMSMTGELVTPVPGIEDAFAEGTECSRLYKSAYCACARIRDRLGAENIDDDLDVIISSHMSIQRELCRRIFIYGALLASNGSIELRNKK